MIKKAHVILFIIYIIAASIISYFKPVSLERYIYSFASFFIFGAIVLIGKFLIEKFDSADAFNKTDRFVFMLTYNILPLGIIWVKSENYLLTALGVYFFLFTIVTLIYIMIVIPPLDELFGGKK